ncbi:hypothetical protein OUZ56_004549 [Daphnia magna]|uniref:Uncharacterized protein n=1 Tax=Daphnia magna TaxID=35525 RepID=A0ABQ9YQ52_9CRUS|nr:hypothetical protein OUZ56_004549 [Daphnia magna]
MSCWASCSPDLCATFAGPTLSTEAVPILLFFCIRKEVVVVDQVQTSPFASKKNTEPMGGAYTVARKCERLFTFEQKQG